MKAGIVEDAAWRAEPALADLLRDPLTHAVMRRDGVSLACLERVIGAAARRLRARSEQEAVA